MPGAGWEVADGNAPFRGAVVKMIESVNKVIRPAGIAILLFVLPLVALSTGGCRGGGGDAARFEVAADIVPMAFVCQAVGGDMVEIETLVPPGASPHSYELSTGQMRFLDGADVLVTVGLGLTPWAEDVFAKVDGDGLATVVAGDVIPRQMLISAGTEHGGEDEEGHGESAEGDESHGYYDPHIWLDPELLAYVVEAVRDAFVEADAGGAPTYRENAERFLEELAILDGEIEAEIASLTDRKFIAFHSSWTYFARRYGMEQVGVIEERPGKEPSAREIAALVDTVKSREVKVVFAEPQFNPRAAEAVAEESGGEVKVAILDPLGDPEDPGADTYLEMMRNNVAVIVEALR